ncbi:hypothetical protein ACJRO7_026066 [Eucalyptus globulus]|uniref:Bidirectional sugar transporter SWEET n=1 Tax=Eucalyptus globulus TaxID=34317 RepID=A0ABD3KD13_EUCGL
MDIPGFCGILGNVVGLLLFLFKRIIRNRSTEQFSGVSYVVTLLSCSFYTWYGLPFVSSDNLLLLIISAMGVVIELTYVLIFIAYAPKKERAKIMGFSGLALIFFLTFAFASLFALQSKNRKLLCSITLDIFSTIMCASPLSVMMMVIKRESVKFMPFLLSLSSFLCGIFWLAYGLLSRDPFFIISNHLIDITLEFFYRALLEQLRTSSLYTPLCHHTRWHLPKEFLQSTRWTESIRKIVRAIKGTC